MNGFDEVYNVLLEHSFRYFGPESKTTKLINENNNWNPTISPDQNQLVKLVDRNLREDNDAYLNFLYVMNYYIFDNFHTKLKYEIKNPENQNIDPNELHFKFDEEELRKVMGNIGYLLLREPTLLNSEKYDYIDLYFQIKKLWSVIITKRYLDDNNFSVDEIKNKIKKSFCIAQLMKIEKARVNIENFLVSFDDIFKNREEVNKHIGEFFKEFCIRYFVYINLGLGRFIKDFRSIISDKFTSIDLLKENLATLNPTDEFHKLLINYLRDESNNLQTETGMQQFIDLIDEKHRELFPPPLSPVDENLDSIEDASVADELLLNNNNPNLNETSLHESQQLNNESNDVNNVDPAATGTVNSQNNFIGSLDNISFTTISTTTPQDNLNLDNNQLNRTIVADPIDNQIDDPYEQLIDNLSERNKNTEDDNLASSQTQLNTEINAEIVNETQAPDPTTATNQLVHSSQGDQPLNNQNIQMEVSNESIPDLTKVSSSSVTFDANKLIKTSPRKTPRKLSRNQPNPNETNMPQATTTVNEEKQQSPTSKETIVEINRAPVAEQISVITTNQPSEPLNRSNSGTDLRDLTELTRLPVNNQSDNDNSQGDFDVPMFGSEDDINTNITPNYHETTNSFLKSLSDNSSSKASPSKRASKNVISDDSDDLGDLGASIKIRRIESERPTTSTATNFLSFDYNSTPISTKSTPKTTLNSFLFDYNPVSARTSKSHSSFHKKSASKTNIKSKSKPSTDDDKPSETTDLEDVETNRKQKSKENKKRKSSVVPLDEPSSSVSSSNKRKQPTKRSQSESSSDDDDVQAPKLSKQPDLKLSKEEIERIIKNQPVIALKQHGKFMHNGELLPTFN